MLGKARRIQLFAQWLGEALREISVLMLIFVPLDIHFRPDTYTPINISLFLFLALFIFSFGVIMGWIGERS